MSGFFLQLLNVTMGTSTTVNYTYYQMRSDAGSEMRNHTHQHPPPTATDRPSSTAVFQWQHMALGDCSQTCGRGLRTLMPRCIDVEFPLFMQDERHCEDLEKPLPMVEECISRDCHAR